MITFKPFILISALLALSACSTAKLEARLEANPQCKDVVNTKTGALMPCPGSDKAFYASVGLAPAKPSAATNSDSSSSPSTQTSGTPSASTQVAPKSALNTTSSTTPATAPTDCKAQIHKKTGGTLPCPAAD